MLREIEAGGENGAPATAVQLWFGSAAARGARDREGRVSRVAGILGRLPPPHLALLAEVPILIVSTFPGGSTRGGGGWYPPEDGNPPMAVWFGGASRAAAEAPPDQLRTLRHRRGIIGWKDYRFLERPSPTDERRRIVPPGLSILHEVGHCVDHHLDLTSRGSPAYRCGLGPYAGQRYSPPSVNEFKAETYARAFERPGGMCRGNHPPRDCGRFRVNCTVRLQTDLLRSPAFAMLPDAHRYLPRGLTGPIASSEPPRGTLSRGVAHARSAAGIEPAADEEPAQGRRPGPLGASSRGAWG